MHFILGIIAQILLELAPLFDIYIFKFHSIVLHNIVLILF